MGWPSQGSFGAGAWVSDTESAWKASRHLKVRNVLQLSKGVVLTDADSRTCLKTSLMKASWDSIASAAQGEGILAGRTDRTGFSTHAVPQRRSLPFAVNSLRDGVYVKG